MKRVLLPLFCICGFCLLITGCSEPESRKQTAACSPDQGNACIAEGTETESGFEPMTFDESIALFENKGSGILYYGFKDCPWCAEAVPVLEEVRKEYDQTIYYIRTRDENRERLYTDEQKEKIAPYLKDYMSENEEGILTLFVPCVVVVKDGQVIDGHVGTVEGHDAHERKITAEEQEQLKKKYEDMLSESASH